MAGDTQADTQTTVAGGSLQSWVSVYLKGIAMGSADSVPGVSGGTIALILGIYERLITAVAELDPRALLHAGRLHRAEGRRDLWRDLLSMDVPFLVVLGTGVVTAVIVVTRLLHTLLETQRALTFAFFFGLIAASVVVFYDELTLDTPLRIGAAVAGFAIAFFISGITTESAVPHALPLLFVVGMIAISAMILPGVSGAFFLLLFGQYEYLSGVLGDFVDAILALVIGDGSLAGVIEPGIVVTVFISGALIGLLSTARGVRRALDSYRVATLSFLVALMLGALRFPLERIIESTTSYGPVTVGSLLAAAVVGGVAVLLLERYTSSLDY